MVYREGRRSLGRSYAGPSSHLGLNIREGPGLVQKPWSSDLHSLTAKCASLSLSLFFREAGHSACARSVPFSPVLSTLATFPRDSAAPNVWVSDSFKVKEHCNIFLLVSTERVRPHGCAGSSGCPVFMATSLIKGVTSGHKGWGWGSLFRGLCEVSSLLICDLVHQTA